MGVPKADLLNQLSRSQIYRDYEQAFAVATNLPLALRPPQNWSLAHHGRKNENPFCALLAESNRGCADCLEIQEKIANNETSAGKSATCFAGLCDTAVPIRVGQNLIGFLQTGQVSLRKPSRAKFQQISRKIVEWGAQVDLRLLEDAYFHSKVLSPEQYSGVVRLLEIFGCHLSVISNQLVLQEESAESPFSKRAKAFLAEHQSEEITLEEVAKALHVSTFYFCKMFKKATGLTFTDYLGRVRIERAKTLLLNPNLRISEVAYEVGFGSLTHFNRIFRKLVGESPSDFREKVPHPEPKADAIAG